jgi:hypothetical protein
MVAFGANDFGDSPFCAVTPALLALNGNTNVQPKTFPAIDTIPIPDFVYTALEQTSQVDVTTALYLSEGDASLPFRISVQINVAPLPFPLVPRATISFDVTELSTQLSFPFVVSPLDLVWVVTTQIEPNPNLPPRWLMMKVVTLNFRA